MSLIRRGARVFCFSRSVATVSVQTENEDNAPSFSGAYNRQRRRGKRCDTFGLLGSFGHGVPLFRNRNPSFAKPNETGWAKYRKKDYEEPTLGLRRYDMKEQNSVPLISEPVSWTKARKKKIEKKEEALREFEKLYGVNRERAKVVISCARKDFNHFENMRYPSSNIPLISQYWRKCKYKNDWFIIEPTAKIPSLNYGNDYCWEQFVDILDFAVVQNAVALGYLKPTTIQVQSFAALSGTRHIFIAAETGSGKTAAYVIPLISQLLKKRRCGEKAKMLVLVQSKELVIQTKSVIESLAASTTIRIYERDSDKKASEGVAVGSLPLESDWDILISTPGLAHKILLEHAARFIDTVVIDEADMLLNDKFVGVLSDLFTLVKLRSSETNRGGIGGARVIFASASCPKELEDNVESLVDASDLYYVKSKHLHYLLPHIKQKFLRVREMDRMDLLVKILDVPNTKGQTLVFCNDKETRNYIAATLLAHGILNTVVGEKDMERIFQDLVSKESGVLVATDLAARGLDFPNLAHVINYDFPRTLVDYIHRVGRVGRASSNFRSRVTSFVRRPWEVSHVNSIELAARLNRPISQKEADISDVLTERHTPDE